MGAPKKKWNPDEEAALKAGIERYGPGKWSAILNDPEFREVLQARTNVDLKDKWRNINVMLNGVGYRQRGIGASRNAKNPKPKVKALAAASETQIPKPQNKALAAGSVIPDSEIQIQIQIPKPQNRAVVASGSGFTDVDILDVKPLATISKDVEPLETGPPVVNRAFRPLIQEVEKRGVKTAVNHEISFDLQKLMNMTADEAAVAAARAVAEAEAAMEAAERAVKEAEAAEEAAEAARQFAQAANRAYKCVRLN